MVMSSPSNDISEQDNYELEITRKPINITQDALDALFDLKMQALSHLVDYLNHCKEFERASSKELDILIDIIKEFNRIFGQTDSSYQHLLTLAKLSSDTHGSDLDQVLENEYSKTYNLYDHVMFEEGSLVNPKDFEHIESCYSIPFGASQKDIDSCQQLETRAQLEMVGEITIKIRGYIDDEFFDHINSQSTTDLGKYPHIKFVYQVPLPNGKYYDFVIRDSKFESKKNKNENLAYGNEDADLLRGFLKIVQASNNSNEVYRIFSKESLATLDIIDEPNEFLNRHRDKIINKILETSSNLTERETLKDKCFGVHTFNCFDEFKNYFREFLKERDSHPLNPKPNELRVPPQEIENFVDEYAPILYRVYTQNKDLIANEESNLHANSIREQKGYKGPKHGFPLIFEYQVFDMIADKLKKINYVKAKRKKNPNAEIEIPKRIGRSYDKQYETIDELESKLNDDIFTEEFKISVKGFNGLLMESDKIEDVESIHEAVEINGLSHYEKALADCKETGEEVVSKVSGYKMDPIKDYESKIELFYRNEEFNNILKNVGIEQFPNEVDDTNFTELYNYYLNQIKLRRKEIYSSIPRTKGKSAKEDYKKLLDQAKERFEAQFEKLKRILSGYRTMLCIYLNTRWLDEKDNPLTYKLNITHKNLAKFIYIIDSDENGNDNVYIAPEAIGKTANHRIRPTHSEVAKGLKVYGAGEIILGYNNDSISSFAAWYEMQLKKKELKLFEINNLSGHYQPEADLFLLYANNLICPAVAAQGINIEDVKLENRLVPGVVFSGASFWN